MHFYALLATLRQVLKRPTVWHLSVKKVRWGETLDSAIPCHLSKYFHSQQRLSFCSLCSDHPTTHYYPYYFRYLLYCSVYVDEQGYLPRKRGVSRGPSATKTSRAKWFAPFATWASWTRRKEAGHPGNKRLNVKVNSYNSMCWAISYWPASCSSPCLCSWSFVFAFSDAKWLDAEDGKARPICRTFPAKM